MIAMTTNNSTNVNADVGARIRPCRIRCNWDMAWTYLVLKDSTRLRFRQGTPQTHRSMAILIRLSLTLIGCDEGQLQQLVNPLW
jgi:hypothetical protein